MVKYDEKFQKLLPSVSGYKSLFIPLNTSLVKKETWILATACVLCKSGCQACFGTDPKRAKALPNVFACFGQACFCAGPKHAKYFLNLFSSLCLIGSRKNFKEWVKVLRMGWVEENDGVGCLQEALRVFLTDFFIDFPQNFSPLFYVF